MLKPAAFAAATLAIVAATWLQTAQADSIHATPGMVLAEYTRDAGTGASPERGQALLERLESGATRLELETDGPVDHAKMEQWFAARCQARLNRACSALEKADVASWLIKEQAMAAPAASAPAR